MSHENGGESRGRRNAALFVERRTYRRRRLMDISRILPLIGALLFLVPLMWPSRDIYPAPGTGGGVAMSEAITYFFVVWAVLILASFAFGSAVRRWAENWTEGTDQPGEDRP